MSRKRKPIGNHKHNADKCRICAKPEEYRDKVRLRLLSAIDEDELDDDELGIFDVIAKLASITEKESDNH